MNNTEKPYIDLLKNTLTDYYRLEHTIWSPVKNFNRSNIKSVLLREINKRLRKSDKAICRKLEQSKELREIGKDFPPYAETMIGIKRLDNLEYCIDEILKNKIQGDLIETGVWRGGATIFMSAMLKVNNDTNRKIWVADSFEGLPKPNEAVYEADKGDEHFLHKELAIGLEDVKRNFEKYGLLNDQVKFLKGWFKDTLPKAPIEKLSLIRLDGDMYESTMDGLVNLYPKLSQGGYLIIDDYGAVEGCRLAVEDYRKKHDITEKLEKVDWTCFFWKKES